MPLKIIRNRFVFCSFFLSLFAAPDLAAITIAFGYLKVLGASPLLGGRMALSNCYFGLVTSHTRKGHFTLY